MIENFTLVIYLDHTGSVQHGAVNIGGRSPEALEILVLIHERNGEEVIGFPILLAHSTHAVSDTEWVFLLKRNLFNGT